MSQQRYCTLAEGQKDINISSVVLYRKINGLNKELPVRQTARKLYQQTYLLSLQWSVSQAH